MTYSVRYTAVEPFVTSRVRSLDGAPVVPVALRALDMELYVRCGTLEHEGEW